MAEAEALRRDNGYKRQVLGWTLRVVGLIVGVYGAYRMNVAGDLSGGQSLLALAVLPAALSHPLIFRVLAHTVRRTVGTLKRH